MRLSKAQLKALEAVEEQGRSKKSRLAYRGMRSSTREILITLGFMIRVTIDLGMVGLEITPAGRKALEEARNGK